MTATYVPVVLKALEGESFKTVFEPACGDGQNIKAIDHQFPGVETLGCDIEGEKWGYPVCDILSLDTTREYDVVLIAATLLLFEDADSDRIMEMAKKMATRFIILVEAQSNTTENHDKKVNRFSRDYLKHFKGKEVTMYPVGWPAADIQGSVIKIRL